MRADIPAAAAAGALRGNAQRQRNQLHKDAAAHFAALNKVLCDSRAGTSLSGQEHSLPPSDFFFLFFFLFFTLLSLSASESENRPHCKLKTLQPRLF